MLGREDVQTLFRVLHVLKREYSVFVVVVAGKNGFSNWDVIGM